MVLLLLLVPPSSAEPKQKSGIKHAMKSSKLKSRISQYKHSFLREESLSFEARGAFFDGRFDPHFAMLLRVLSDLFKRKSHASMLETECRSLCNALSFRQPICVSNITCL